MEMNKTVAFIACVNNIERYKQCTKHIQNLRIPTGYKIETIPIKEAIGMASGYNSAMRNSKSKYKVYLHQDVDITVPNFIQNIIDLFNKYPRLGLLGVVGARNIPHSGVWWESKECYGKVYATLPSKHKGAELLQFKNVSEDYKNVKAIDGLMMITQYDISWREDLFTRWHFYDISQSLEFIKAGFEVGVPKQIECWCVHECGKVSMKNYNRYKRRFVKEYRQFLGESNDTIAK